jgi:protein NrfD
LLVVRAIVADQERARAPASSDDALAALRLLRRVVLAGIGVYFALEFAEFSIAMWNPQADAAELSLVLTGPYWWVFWIVHVLLGGIVPMALLATRRPRAWVVAGGLVAVTFLSSRLNLLVPGQAVSELEGLQAAFVHPRLDFVYHATAMEYLVSFFLVAVGMAILYAGLHLSALFETRWIHEEPTDASV